MKDLVFFIPAQEENKYHKLGDLAPFGDTTLLQWKISQCKTIVNTDCIYISSTSDKIKDISEKEGVNYIERVDADFENELKILAKNIEESVIIWTNVTSPFLGKSEYLKMYKEFTSNDCNLLISILERKDYAFYDNKKINFGNTFIDRTDIAPINICTNGAYIFNKEYIVQTNSLLDTEKIYLSKLDKLPSVEIKDIIDYSISKDLISLYFSNLVKNN